MDDSFDSVEVDGEEDTFIIHEGDQESFILNFDPFE